MGRERQMDAREQARRERVAQERGNAEGRMRHLEAAMPTLAKQISDLRLAQARDAKIQAGLREEIAEQDVVMRGLQRRLRSLEGRAHPEPEPRREPRREPPPVVRRERG